MKIAYFGDSITEGIPGVNYVNIVKNKRPHDEHLNYGYGGDTISSLYTRITSLELDDDIDVSVLFIGINDTYGKINKNHRRIHKVRNQPMAETKEEFQTQYQELIDYLVTKSSKLIVLPPLVVGEDLQNKWNKEVAKHTEIIENIVKNKKDLIYLDTRKAFLDILKNNKQSTYLGKNLFQVGMDVFRLKTVGKVDETAQKRGLHLTLDGVHLNSVGANIIADSISKIIEVI